MFKSFFSNRLEVLFEELKYNLFIRQSLPFQRRLIIVPSLAIKTWLTLKLAQDLKISMGLEIVYLQTSIYRFLHMQGLSFKDKPFLCELELAFLIEHEIKECIASWPSFDFEKQKRWEPLFTYLKVEELHTVPKITKKGAKRLSALSNRLAAQFLNYALYGEQMLKTWEEAKFSVHWQAELWSRIFNHHRCEGLLLQELLKQEFHSLDNVSIHLFGINFFPSVYHQFFSKAAHHCPIDFYLLSPCQLYWNDFLSNYQTRKLVVSLQKKGVKETQISSLEDYLSDQHPLLANYGKIGRMMNELIDTNQAIVQERYVVDASAIEHEAYLDYLQDSEVISEQARLNALKAIQTDMLLLVDPRRRIKINVDKNDNSIQIHEVSSKWREVEIVYDLLLNLIDCSQKQGRPILPQEILVLAPDVKLYAPYIEGIFGQKDSILDYQMLDIDPFAKNQLLAGYKHLFSLAVSRWDSLSVLTLLDCEPFTAKQNLSPEDVIKIRDWILKADVRWGDDLLHRLELIKKQHGQMPGQLSEVGTWKRATEGVVHNLISMRLSDNHDQLLYPSFDLDWKQAELLGKWIYLIKSLKEDLQPIADDEQLTLEEWGIYLKCLLHTYFEVENCKESIELESTLNTIEDASLIVPISKYSFQSVYKQLEKKLNQLEKPYHETHLQAVRFCSMLPMRAVPSEVVILMGMNEGVFPRSLQSEPLDLLKEEQNREERPSNTDYDRYLFLETLLSARRHFILTYVIQKENGPSIAITDLLQILDETFSYGEEQIFSHIHFYRHCLTPFDSTYFTPQSQFKSFSQFYYQVSCLEQKALKKTSPYFLAPLSQRPTLTFEIDIKDLNVFSKNPLKHFFNRSLGMFLQDRQKTFKTDEPFLLSGLERYHLRKAVMRVPVEIKEDYAKRWAPGGFFREAEEYKLSKELSDWQDNLKHLNIDPKQLLKIHFNDFLMGQFSEEDLFFPTLKILTSEGEYIIRGTIENVTAQGLVCFTREDFQECIKCWPQLLLLNYASSLYQLPFCSQLLFPRNGTLRALPIQNCEEELVKYLKYFIQSQTKASLLTPEWVKTFVEADKDSCFEEIKQSLDHPFQRIENDYAQWVFRHLQHAPEELEEWVEMSKDLFLEAKNLWKKR